MKEKADLYRCSLPEGLRLPILVQQLDIADEIPKEAEVETAVKGLKGGRAGFLLRMHTEDLKGWIREAMRKREPVRTQCDILVRLVQRTFEDRAPRTELAWATMVLIPKGKGVY